MKMRMIGGLLLLLSADPALACLPGFEGAPQTREGDIAIAYRVTPDRVPVGQPFSLDIAICPAPQSLRVDAQMPAHRHGMNYRPSIAAAGPGRYRAEGLLFHMPGDWEFVFDITTTAGQHRRIAMPVRTP